MNHAMTRRNVLKLCAAAAPIATATTAAAGVEPIDVDRPAADKPVVGVSTLGFHEYTNAELAAMLADNGLHTIQLFLKQKDSDYWRYNSRNDVSALDADRCKAIADAYRSKGIAIHSIGVYTNLIHPDPAERAANLAYFADMMRIGAAMDVKTFITEAGHYDPPEHAGGVAYHFLEDVWDRTVATGKELVKIGGDYDAKVLVEPFYRGFFASAKRTRLFLEAVDSPRLRCLLDPANLIELNDQEEMFAQLAPYIDCLHAKDRKLHVPQGVAAGEGDLDYVKFARLAAKHAPRAPFILEYVGPADYKQARDLLVTALRAHTR